MRRLAVWTLQAALLLGAGAAATAAQEPSRDSPPAKGNWLSRLLPFGKKEEAKAPPAPAKTTVPPPTAGPPVESAATRRAREKATLDRRWAVCQKLYDIALDNNDDGLRRMADQLSDRAFEIYCRHTGPAAPAGGSFQSDEQTLAQHLPLRGGPNSQGPVAASVGGRNGESASRSAARRVEP